MIRRLVAVAFAVALVPAGLPAAPSQGAQAMPQEDPFLKGVYSIGRAPDAPRPQGLQSPKVKTSAYPKYTAAAMREKLQGQVELQVVVAADGTVARARVTKSLDTTFGLDDQALLAAKSWTFEPATLNGDKVAVAVYIMLEFRLH